jgi:hypothetical protein
MVDAIFVQLLRGSLLYKKLSVKIFLEEIVLGFTEAPVCPQSPKNTSSLP